MRTLLGVPIARGAAGRGIANTGHASCCGAASYRQHRLLPAGRLWGAKQQCYTVMKTCREVVYEQQQYTCYKKCYETVYDTKTIEC